MFRQLTLVAFIAVTAACASPRAADDAMRRDAAVAAGIAPAAVAASDDAAIAARVNELLAQPLSRDDAVTLALLNNPQLAQRLAQLRIDASERVRASRPPNPSLSLGRFTRGTERENDRAVSIDLIGLLAWPFTGGAADRQFSAARADALQDALGIAAQTGVAWIDAIAADADRQYAQAVADAADTGFQYAKRLADAGNASQLEATQAKVFHIEADTELARAQVASANARERLLKLLGISDPARLQLPPALPPLPDTPLAQQATEQQAMEQRLDVQAARQHVDATARALHLNRVTRMVNVLDVGYQSNTSNQAPTQTGVEVTLELPLFDFGSASGNEARARYDAALAGVSATAVAARSDVRSAWMQYQSAWNIAKRHRDEVLPLTSGITREMILRHNGMLIGPFELLAQAREQASATARWHAALRDFWLADANLAAALLGNPPARDAAGTP